MITPEERANRAVETAFWEYVDDNLDVMRRHEIYEDFENAIAGEIHAAIAEARPRWIPVSERLPELYQTVLVWREGIPTWVGAITAFWTGEKWCQDVMGDAFIVTHWQPLSPPPEATP